jgi:hypothetical protein
LLLVGFASTALLRGNHQVNAAPVLAVRAVTPLLSRDPAEPGRPVTACPDLDTFDYQQALSGPANSLSPVLESANAATGMVTVNGGDLRQPSQPFVFDWDDGSTSTGFFPSTHTFGDVRRNYTIHVTAHYPGGTTGEASVPLWFRPPIVSPVSLEPGLTVTIPAALPVLGTRLYPVPPNLTALSADTLGGLPRTAAEYLLSVVAQLQHNYANHDVVPVAGAFHQVVLRDPTMRGGMYSLWFTSPVALAVGADDFRFESQLSSVFHEMGHNVTLNSPASFQYGGHIDGPANAIFSEAMAQVFQHATVYDLVRDGATYGLGCDIRGAVEASGLASFGVLRSAYEEYVRSGARYSSWNNPATPGDETVGTFMTVAFKFFEHAQAAGTGVHDPLQRMMRVLQTFDASMQQSYDPLHDSPQGSSFRATLMVAALSAALDTDMRQEFRALGFPIDDTTFAALGGP